MKRLRAVLVARYKERYCASDRALFPADCELRSGQLVKAAPERMRVTHRFFPIWQVNLRS